MMEKRHRKLSLIVALLAVMLIASLAFAACSSSSYAIKLDRTSISLEMGESVELGYQITKNGEVDTETGIDVGVSGDSVTYSAETNKITAVKIGKSEITVSVKGHNKASAKLTVTVPEYEIEIKGGTSQKADLGGEGIVEYTVLKDGTKVTDKKVVMTASGEAIKYEKIGNRVYFVEEGEGKVKVALADDPAVYSEVTYTVAKSFWNSGSHQVNKDAMTITDNSVYIPGGNGNQYFLGVLDGGTKYVFKTKLTIPSASSIGNQTVGVTHDFDQNNAGFWIGVHSADNATYEIWTKNFLSGWTGKKHIDKVLYQNVTFDDDTIEVITVRDGNKVWYSVDGYCGTLDIPEAGEPSLSAEALTWAGIFSQERKLTATDFSYSTDETEIAEAKAACETPLTVKFDVTNKQVNMIVKGQSYTYTAEVIKTLNATTVPAVEWTLDKTAMTAGQEDTSIANGTLTVAEDAAGVVTVIATCDGKEVKFDVNILSESLAKENETLKVDGGVDLADDGTVTFTETFNYNNATLSDSAYQDLYYAAVMKGKVKGDFEFAFTLTEMKSASTPKFLVSLGESMGNFIFTNNSVSVKTSATYTAEFTAADTLEVVIKVVAGHYAVSVNGADLTFNGDPIRRIEDYTAERPVLFTTGAGTSVKVSAISLTDKTDAELIVANNKTEYIKEGNEVVGIKIGFIADGWTSRNNGTTRTYFGKLLPTGDYTLSMKATFSAAMPDTKLGVQIGDQEFHISNGNGTIITELCNNNSWHDKRQDLAINALSVDLEFKQIGNKLYFFVNGVQHNEVNVPASRILTFWTFDNNANASPAGSTVSVTEISLTDGAIIASINGKNVVQAGETASYTATVLGASEEDVTWEFDNSGLTAGTATFTNKTLTLNGEALGTVVITLKHGGKVVAELSVSISNQPANQNTAIAESVGGVKQDVDNGIISFDNASKNGVAHEDYYSEESGYYAILNTAANTRATIQDNFVLQFTVSNYVTTATSPKLMISLGYKHEQFYIAYTSQGPRIEACLVDVATSNSKAYRWVNSEYFTGFDTNASHVYKLVCEDGIYSMTVDNTAITFPSTLYRRVDTMAFARNIMFSTNANTTANVSNISLTAVTGKEGKVTATYADNFVDNGDGTITATFNKQSRDGRNGYHDANAIYAYNGYVAENSEITLTVTWDDTDLSKYDDETLLIRLGTSDRSIGVVMNKGTEIKLDQQWTFTGYHLTQNDRLKTETDGKKSAKIKITIVNGSFTAVRAMEFNADGTDKGWSEATLALNPGEPNDQKAEGYLTFGTFVYHTPSNCSVTISDINIQNS